MLEQQLLPFLFPFFSICNHDYLDYDQGWKQMIISGSHSWGIGRMRHWSKSEFMNFGHCNRRLQCIILIKKHFRLCLFQVVNHDDSMRISKNCCCLLWWRKTFVYPSFRLFFSCESVMVGSYATAQVHRIPAKMCQKVAETQKRFDLCYDVSNRST